MTASPIGYLAATDTDAWFSEDGTDWKHLDTSRLDMYDSNLDWFMPGTRKVSAAFADPTTHELYLPVHVGTRDANGFLIVGPGGDDRWESVESLGKFRFSSMGPSGRIETYAGSTYVRHAPGIAAENLTFPTNATTVFPASTSNGYVAAVNQGERGTSLWFSLDGESWEKTYEDAGNKSIFGFAGSDDGGYAFAASEVGGDIYVAHSMDGVSWERINTPATGWIALGVDISDDYLALVDTDGNVYVLRR